MPLLSDDEVTAGLEGGDWRREGETIVRDRRFADFAAAIAFVERVAEVAEDANHHPDILVHGWNKVQLTLSTHSEGGITAADLALARQLDAVR
ncbi:MAG TPA: 4a-hydroxytetrahydrobiopterin dehydratase [Conexibacter sp.]|jgi:4a-hydroxytetrahydrobiopterin dehydratase|nr:4a-hydroxytetrahydrobiopterin dehydratase [Conexibacter sp.]